MACVACLRALPLLLLLGACSGPGPTEEVVSMWVHDALAGPSALLYGLCPEAPPLGHDSFTGLTDVQITRLSAGSRRVRVAVRGVPLAPTEQGEQEKAAVVCEGEVEVILAPSREPALEQLRLVRGRKPGATLQ